MCYRYFIGVSYIVLIYAQGYQYSFKEGKFIRSGALYINVNTSASILIDDKLKTSTSSWKLRQYWRTFTGNITQSVFKRRLVVMAKVTITAGFVEDFSHVMLLPQTGQDKENVRQEIHDLLYPVVASSSVSPSPSRSPRQHQLPKLNLIPPPSTHCRPPIEASRIIWMRARFI